MQIHFSLSPSFHLPHCLSLFLPFIINLTCLSLSLSLFSPRLVHSSFHSSSSYHISHGGGFGGGGLGAVVLAAAMGTVKLTLFFFLLFLFSFFFFHFFLSLSLSLRLFPPHQLYSSHPPPTRTPLSLVYVLMHLCPTPALHVHSLFTHYLLVPLDVLFTHLSHVTYLFLFLPCQCVNVSSFSHSHATCVTLSPLCVSLFERKNGPLSSSSSSSSFPVHVSLGFLSLPLPPFLFVSLVLFNCSRVKCCKVFVNWCKKVRNETKKTG